jgi:hypothetical protein
VTELHVHDWSPWGPSPLAVIAGVERRQRTCRGCDLTQDEPTPDVQKTPAWFGSAGHQGGHEAHEENPGWDDPDVPESMRPGWILGGAPDEVRGPNDG